jgi:hypothetical protein
VKGIRNLDSRFAHIYTVRELISCRGRLPGSFQDAGQTFQDREAVILRLAESLRQNQAHKEVTNCHFRPAEDQAEGICTADDWEAQLYQGA